MYSHKHACTHTLTGTLMVPKTSLSGTYCTKPPVILQLINTYTYTYTHTTHNTYAQSMDF